MMKQNSKLIKELGIVFLWIVIYGLASNISIALSDFIHVPNSITAVAYIALCIVMIFMLYKRKKLKYYGFHSLKELDAKNLLYFIPFVIVASVNIWSGIHINHSMIQIILIAICMICVAFIEEVIFRAFLMKALMNISSVLAIIVSSSLFGIIHLMNILSGAELLATILQVFYAMAFGFMCAAFFYKTDNIIPCIICHGVGNALDVFLPEDLSVTMQCGGCIAIVFFGSLYGIYLLTTKKKLRNI